MSNAIFNYLKSVNTRYKTGISTEHSYRGDFQTLIETIRPDILATNEPTRVACGAPDFILTHRNIPVGYVEAKDIGKPLGSKDYKEQFERYKSSLTKLIITDYLDFWFYHEGDLITKISIGEISGNRIKPLEGNFKTFTDLIIDFCELGGITIQSALKLSKMMAGKARMLARIIESALTSDEENEEDSTLKEQLSAFQKILIHDIKPKEFADIYAQSIAYGMFAARLHDTTLENFSRKEAAELIPKSNPFLRKLFQYIAGYDLDDRIVWIVDALADIFRATDVKAIMENFGKSTEQNDPVIHFYETFLAKYDPKLRKSRGVWYTPEPVVNFIVRAVDEILKTEFGLAQGLADTTKTKIQVNVPTHDKRAKSGFKKIEQEVHKVQILDPATGTGTFLAEVVKQIYKRFKGQEGIWTNYVENHLIPRLNGFEILMASYAMAHLKLELLLNETGFKPKKEQRFRIYLTNSLEEHHPDTGTLWANWLSSEANEANHVKRDTPIMVVIGNPPYSVSSSNKSEWIVKLMNDYKKNLNERNIQPLSDDYIKFFRYAQYFVDKNGEGIVAFISNNSFIDGLIHRQMRNNILQSFDKILIFDLHGSTKKNERTLDGEIDKNVFDIQQGVSINILIKNKVNKKTTTGEVYHYDMLGTRESKYEMLTNSSINDIAWEKLSPSSPNYFFIPKKVEDENYNSWISIRDLFSIQTSGIKTHRDAFVISIDKKNLEERIEKFYDPTIQNDFILTNYKIKSNDNWLNEKRKGVYDPHALKEVYYRPFDIRWIYYSPDLVDRGRERIFDMSIEDTNIGLLTCRQQSTFDFQHVLVTKNLADMCSVSLQTKETGYYFPLYTYRGNKNQATLDFSKNREHNLNKSIINEFVDKIGIKFTNDKIESDEVFSPIDIFDYVYAILHQPTYRGKYKDLLKIDFPKIPYPSDIQIFWKLVNLGKELRNLHLMESTILDHLKSTYPINGENYISKKITQKDFKFTSDDKSTGRIMINDEQYFDNIPVVAWEFYIGGYQPAQKWLKDRHGRQLSFDDIMHYQKIIATLFETDRIMKEIDSIGGEF